MVQKEKVVIISETEMCESGRERERERDVSVSGIMRTERDIRCQ